MNRSVMRSKIKYLGIKIAAILAAGVLSGCGNLFPEGSPVISPEDEAVKTGPIIYGPDSYDSADTPILIKKDEEKNTLTFYNLDVEKNYTLEYDGTTCFYDKYGGTISLSQLSPGDIVDITFIKEKKHLTTMSISKSAWVISETDRFSLDDIKKEITIGEDTYKVSSSACYFSDGRQITQQDIIATDRLTFHGIDNRIYSVTVDKGHGYLRLTGHQGFVDGWIEIGNSVIQKVSQDMLITVPEGSYQVKISAAGTTAEKSVVINRNSESTLDFSDVEFAKPKTGTVLFSLSPKEAKLYIDGELTDVSEKVELSYGLHQLICKADGYTSITRYLNVGQAAAGIDITLEKIEKDSDKDKEDDKDKDKDNDKDKEKDNTDGNGSGSGESKENETTENNNGNSGGTVEGKDGESQSSENTDLSSGEQEMDITQTYYQVYIDSPAMAEVYVDGTYVGISPCTFKKTPGMHIITLSQNGYLTRSYTVTVDSDDKDVSFSFADLVKEP